MAGSLSDYAETKVLDHLLGNTTFAIPTNLYVGLSTGTIVDTMVGETCNECAGDDYARIEMNSWDAATGRIIVNTDVVTFAEAGTEGAWGTITDWFIADASVDGNIIAYGTFNPSKVVGTGDDASIAAGAITITVDPDGMSDFCAHEILDHIFKNGEYAQPTNIYVGLAKSDIADGSSGDDCDEVDGSNYSRKQQDTWNAASAVTAETENTQAITFSVASASWDTVTHFFLSPDSANGNILFHGTVDTSKSVGDGDTVQWDVETLTISLD